MNTNYFYTDIVENQNNSAFLNSIMSIAEQKKQQVYVLSRPLADRKYDYDGSKVMILLSSKRKIAFVTTSQIDDDFDELCDDIIDDIGSISDKYDYKSVIGRPRKWKDELTAKFSTTEIGTDLESWFNEEIVLIDSSQHRRLDLIISLFIGSINDVSHITADEPDNILDKVKNKIQLFDGQQTRFIYEELETEGKKITIQGLSGTGKTELLLHKLKDLYIQDKESRYCFTCFNKILSRKLKSRIPEFFNFMKVEQQIEWERLMCIPAWGSYNSPDSGVYRYLCEYYQIPFYSLREVGTLEQACKLALKVVQPLIKQKGFAFDFTFIDESQDFRDSFIDLCVAVTRNKVFVAGDIFQSIFEEKKKNTAPISVLLSKCYRTDPKTLMFAQALGMGLFEDRKLWWLEKEQWQQCGYNVEEKDGKYILTREPLRRFEDIDSDFDSIKIYGVRDLESSVIQMIQELYKEFPTVQPNDIAIIFLDNESYIYQTAEDIRIKIGMELGIDCNIAYETKRDISGQILISNRNNVKGLEYPFVICITKQIIRDKSYRNTLYTMLTRSFIRSYLVLPNSKTNGFTEELQQGAESIMKEKHIVVDIPTEEEKEELKAWTKQGGVAKSLQERINEICDKIGLTDLNTRETVQQALEKIPAKTSDNELEELVSHYLDVYNKR